MISVKNSLLLSLICVVSIFVRDVYKFLEKCFVDQYCLIQSDG